MFDQKAYHSQWIKDHPDKIKQYNNKWRASYEYKKWYAEYMQSIVYKESKLRTRLKTRYGITLEQYNQMLEEQQGLCYLCGKSPKENDRLCVDHDGLTKVVRKLLCRQCNVGIGNLKHNAVLLRKAANYLEEDKI